MKTKNLTFLLIMAFALCTQAQNFKTPVDYLEFIGKEQTSISKSLWNYNKSIAHSKSARRVDATRNQLIKTIQTASKKIQGLKNGYEGDTDYQNAVIEYLTVSENMIKNDYEKVIDLKEVAEQSYDFMEAYIKTQELLNEKSKEELDKVRNAQKLFAEKYQVTLTESEDDLSKKLRISNEIFTYQNELYLIFFKANFTYGLLNESLMENDLAALQQNGSTLQAYTLEGLEKLKSISPYNKDSSLLNATKKTLEYFEKNASNYVTEIMDFTDFNTQFEEIKNALERKKDKERTKEEIDRYNKMVKEINKRIKDYNTLNTKFIQAVNQESEHWHTTSENFAAKHIPKA